MRTVTVTGQGEARGRARHRGRPRLGAHRAAGVAEALAGADSAADAIVGDRPASTRPRSGSARPSLQIWPAHDDTRAGRPASRRGTR